MNLSKTIPFLSVKDHSVSGETFDLLYHEEYDMLITNPQPSLENLPRYYETEDYISHTDGKRTLFEKLYQFIKNIALNRKLNLINSSSETGTLLDIGAGTGDFLVFCKINGWNVTGIEPSQKASLIANKKGLDYETSLSNLKDNSFDVITMWHVLEHVPDLENQIKELKRLLKPNGTLFIAVPNFKSFDANYYKEFWAAFDVPIHFWHFSKTAIKKLFFEQNMILTKIEPMKFDSYYVALLSEKYKTGKMNFVRAFIIGAISNWKAKRNFEYSSLIYVIKHKN